MKLDIRIDEVVLKALENKPDLRFSQAGEVKTEIENINATPGAPAARHPVKTSAPASPGHKPSVIRLLIVILAIAIGAYVGYRLASQTWKYRSTATVQVKPTRLPSSVPVSAETIFQAIQSSAVLKPVAARINSSADSETKTIALSRALTVQGIRGTELYAISVDADTPREAASLANAVAESFQSHQAKLDAERATQSLAQLDAEVEDRRRRIDEAQARMNALRAGVSDVSPSLEADKDADAARHAQRANTPRQKETTCASRTSSTQLSEGLRHFRRN